MRRREFIILFGGGIAYPLVSRAQQPDRVRRIGVLLTLAEDDPAAQLRIQAFRHQLQELGWTEGRNIQIAYRFAAGDIRRVRLNAEEMLRVAPEVIVAANTQTVEALQRATQTVPIVFVQVADPVGRSFVESLARPGGNITGFANAIEPLYGKRLQLLNEIASHVTRVAIMFNPETVLAPILQEFEELAPSFSMKPISAPVHNSADIENALADLAREQGGALVVAGDIFFTALLREQIIAAAARHRVPTIYPYRIFAGSGGLISYGIDQNENYRGAAFYVDRIFKGEKPANLPVQRPTKVELVINLKTAKTLGLTVPASLLARADEIIE
jgi:putative ABC transport system substrate-binding protein